MAAGTQSELQKTFIAMIFAFAVSYIAQEFVEFLIVLTNNWQSISAVPMQSAAKMFAVATHMFLALLMISISWVMWSKSKAAGHITDIEKIFSVKFITFILEVLLVTLYYSLARSAEADFTAYGINKSVDTYVTKVSAKPEALQMALIFSLFALWDLIVDVLDSPMTPPLKGARARIVSYFVTGPVVYCSVSIVCTFASLLILWVIPANEPPMLAAIGDFALIAVLLFFNQAKILEYYLLKVFPVENARNNTKTVTPPTLHKWITLVILGLIYLISIAIILLPCIQKSLGL